MSLINLHSVQKSFGGWTLFRGLDFAVNRGARIGMVGPNGAGKSTLLRILAGWDQPEAGTRTVTSGVTVAYLPQHIDGDDRSAVATLLDSRPDIAAINLELKACEAALTSPGIGKDLERMARALRRHEQLLERWVDAGGAGLAGEARRLLKDLSLDDDAQRLPTSLLSGGQRKLLGLASCLIQQPDVLLLDEPETHLDAARREELESLIQGFVGAVVIVSHDRYLLDATVSQIAELDAGTIKLWPGNYSAYAVARELALKRQQEQYVSQQKEIARLEEAIHRFRAWFAIAGDHRNIVRARVKQRQIDRMDKVERPVFERRRMGLEMRPALRGGQKVVQLTDVTVALGDVPVLLDVDLTVMRGERVGVIGPNGAGKTVLGKVIAGLLQPSLGEIWAGPSIRIGYLAQDNPAEVAGSTPMALVRAARAMYEDEATNLLGRFLFRYDQMREPVRKLSGGERTRLEFLLLMLSGANCLMLDEPTNHLDIDSLEVLESELERFDGTAIIISHDRYFLDRIPDRILEVRDGNVRSFDGGYTEWAAAEAQRV